MELPIPLKKSWKQTATGDPGSIPGGAFMASDGNRRKNGGVFVFWHVQTATCFFCLILNSRGMFFVAVSAGSV